MSIVKIVNTPSATSNRELTEQEAKRIAKGIAKIYFTWDFRPSCWGTNYIDGEDFSPWVAFVEECEREFPALSGLWWDCKGWAMEGTCTVSFGTSYTIDIEK